MQLTRLTITGFKSFAEPADILIEPGLTGVVGPNGCGKSNLVEALRWVMGETSHKNMRASEMDDVIFAGTSRRPSRNRAEVRLTLDNTSRTAPAEFNDADVLEVTRLIVRGEGSTFKINGREVRARDVHILFADAATGARSSALVRQGQISDLIAAKPQARRRILEDAAGIAGLYSRRHEAELRLKAADDNLARLDDVLKDISGQTTVLAAQAQQAGRYRTLSAKLRETEAQISALIYFKAREEQAACETAFTKATDVLAEATELQARTATEQALAAHKLEPLRKTEQEAARALQAALVARDVLDGEEKRAKERLKDINLRIEDTERDEERHIALLKDASQMLEKLSGENDLQGPVLSGPTEDEIRLQQQVQALQEQIAATEAHRDDIQKKVSAAQAERNARERTLEDMKKRMLRLSKDEHDVRISCEDLQSPSAETEDLHKQQQDVDQKQQALTAAQTHYDETRTLLAQAREQESSARQPLHKAEKTVQHHEAELKTLQKLFAPRTGDLWPRVLDAIKVEPGYERALGAALGDDLDASTEISAPVHWREITGEFEEVDLPDKVMSLADVTQAPLALRARLRRIGLVSQDQGAQLWSRLQPGQRLVSREGDVWRWDGFFAAAEAPSAAARRLAEKNRLSEIEHNLLVSRQMATECEDNLRRHQQRVQESIQTEQAALNAFHAARKAYDLSREQMVRLENKIRDQATRLSAQTEKLSLLTRDLEEARAQVTQLEHQLLAFTEDEINQSDLATSLAQTRQTLQDLRLEEREAVRGREQLERERLTRNERVSRLQKDIAEWSVRQQTAKKDYDQLLLRKNMQLAQKQEMMDAPDTFLITRRRLLSDIETAEKTHRTAADAVLAAQTHLMTLDKAARDALSAMGQAREMYARRETQRDASIQKYIETSERIAQTTQMKGEALLARYGFDASSPHSLPALSDLEAQNQHLKAERERMGAVNLLAEEELAALNDRQSSLANEREDLMEAIRRLRGAIGSLNREGRERLLAAFSIVNEYFQELFSLLFGGGEAQLKLIESDDPLEAGLEIIARPPGKKPQILTLLSGGEQALTATALIFAVFLTNPSPVCVLDEVDAPLDDANVERYCKLLDDMTRRTQTRFIVITHNPITMARMNRLFGVTMAESGVSTLVSVDLGTANRLREAS